MEWLTSIRAAINYMEDHLLDDISAQDIGEQVHLSPMYLMRGFSVMTGYGIGEYIRNRRLYQAAIDIRDTNEKVIDVALKYCYDTPESFAKAFSRFHGATPSQVRAGAQIRSFLPLKINITILGGSEMDYRIMPMFPFKVIGFERVFDAETAYEEIPAFWDEVFGKYASDLYGGHEPENDIERAVIHYCIGEYGVCIDDIGEGRFRYLIAGKYLGGEVPDGLAVYEFPGSEWAVFNCTGPIPDAMQRVNTHIYSEWLPGNPEYELFGNANVEWYDIRGEKNDPDYRSAIWIPVKRK